MILGVYWYYGFPENLYSYKYFTFRKGLGGHADAPAELLANVCVADADDIIAELKMLADQYPHAFVFAYRSGNDLQIGTGSYAMHDYEFELALKMEQILNKHAAISIPMLNLKDTQIIRLSTHTNPNMDRISKKYFYLVSSSLKKSNAETSMIRFDCNVHEEKKDAFLQAIQSVAENAHIDVVFYLEKKCAERYNLMLFFTNGRQGLGLNPKQHIAIGAFESGMDALMNPYDIQIGHVGGWDYYPQGMHVALKIVDADFIL
jgi:hypothetical protein